MSSINTVFNNVIIIPCFAHLLRNIKKRDLPKELKSNVLEDITFLSNSTSPEEFDFRYNLIINHWKDYKDKKIDDFIEYFDQYYISKNKNWYLGSVNVPGIGNTNNCIEGFNCAIKRHFLDYTRQDIVIFLNCFMTI